MGKFIIEQKLINESTLMIVDAVVDAEMFKIGKTGKTVEQRGEQSDYSDYDELISIAQHNTNMELIDKLEPILIKRFLDNENYKGIIQNKDDESFGEMADEGNGFTIYVAVKYTGRD